MKEPVDLRLDLYETGGAHAQDFMEHLGIHYEKAMPQSMVDQWWFFGCRNVPDPLPRALSVKARTTDIGKNNGNI